MFTDSLGPVIQPEILPQNHTILRNQKPVKQVLVQGNGFPASKNSWEDLLLLQKQYPGLELEEKVSFDEEGNVMFPHLIQMKSQVENQVEAHEGMNANHEELIL